MQRTYARVCYYGAHPIRMEGLSLRITARLSQILASAQFQRVAVKMLHFFPKVISQALLSKAHLWRLHRWGFESAAPSMSEGESCRHCTYLRACM